MNIVIIQHSHDQWIASENYFNLTISWHMDLPYAILWWFLWNSSKHRDSRIQRIFGWCMTFCEDQDSRHDGTKYRILWKSSQNPWEPDPKKKMNRKIPGKQKWHCGIQATAVRAGETKMKNVEFKQNTVRAGQKTQIESEIQAKHRESRMSKTSVEFRAAPVRVYDFICV